MSLIKFVKEGTNWISYAGIGPYGIKNVRHEATYDHGEAKDGYLEF